MCLCNPQRLTDGNPSPLGMPVFFQFFLSFLSFLSFLLYFLLIFHLFHCRCSAKRFFPLLFHLGFPIQMGGQYASHNPKGMGISLDEYRQTY